MHWDDLQFFLELARTGTLTAAARRLEVQHSTVARRIARFEREQGQPLFERSAVGYHLTEAGSALLKEAEQIAEAFARLRPERQSQSDQITGNVRIACTEGFTNYLAGRFLLSLRAAHPSIVVDLLVRPRRILMPRNDADIIINIDHPERGPYLVTRLLDYRLGLFASRGYLASHPPIRRQSDLRAHSFVSYTPEMEPARGLPTVEDVAHTLPPQLRSSSLIAQKMAVRLGYGIALFPHFVALNQPDLEHVLADQVVFRKTYYMSVAQEQRHVPRIAAVWDILKATYTEDVS